jgi:tRNA modification GTPase
LADVPGFRALTGTVRLQRPHPIQVPCRLYLFRAPRSYTRQDVVELHVPGEVPASVLAAGLLEGGARQAEAGEFTARAFFSGRLDLSAAQAVADVVEAEADAQLRAAVGVMEGAVARLCRTASEALTEVLATVEAGIDFADEDIPLAAPGELAGAAGQVARDIQAAAESSLPYLPPRALAHVAIAGRPNVGKSSLLNALSGSERVIVSAMAGTTRDVLSAPARLPGGGEVVLLDAAGMDASCDPLSRAAGAAARQAVAAADAVLFVLDATAVPRALDRQLLEEVVQLNPRAPLVALANKIDLAADPAGLLDQLRRQFQRDFLPTSATTGEGLEAARRTLEDRLADLAAPQSGKLLLHDRQRHALYQAAAAAERAAELLRQAADLDQQAEIVAVELRLALGQLGELVGQTASEEVLAAIFSRFCVGK